MVRRTLSTKQLKDRFRSIETVSTYAESAGSDDVTECSLQSDLEFATPEQTLLFLDWDDTLFPTSALFDAWGLPCKPEAWAFLRLTSPQKEVIWHWADALVVYLRAAVACSARVVILSHAAAGWVEECVKFFAPQVEQVLDQKSICVVYAGRNRRKIRTAAQSNCGDLRSNKDECMSVLTGLKHNAMWRHASAFYSQYPGQTWKNIISVGDGPYEANALHDLNLRRAGPERECLRTKVITCPEAPCVPLLTSRLLMETFLLPLVARHDGDLCLKLPKLDFGRTLELFADHLGLPELRTVMPPEVADEDGGKDCLVESIDELAVVVHNIVVN
jgi:hypothetical protein